MTNAFRTYQIGEIPDLSAWEDQLLVFQISREQLNPGSKIELQLDPQPNGAIKFDNNTFAYQLDAGDKMPFKATFSAKKGELPVSQTVTITPFPKPFSDRDYVAEIVDKPNPESGLFRHHSMFTNSDRSENHLVSGMCVIFKRGHENGLFKTFNKPRTEKIADDASSKDQVKQLTICADKLEIHGYLSLPETYVTIFCRELIFKDDSNEPGCIDVSPLEFKSLKAPELKNGAKGHSAGNITLFAGRVITPTNMRPPIFILRGGRGQDAGEGKDGRDGNTVDTCGTHDIECEDNWGHRRTWTYNLDPVATYIEGQRRWFDIKRGRWTFKEPSNWPTDGTDAEVPGKPGNGGDGGVFRSNQKLSILVSKSAGVSGNKARDVWGGRHGYPEKSAHYYFDIKEADTDVNRTEINQRITDKRTVCNGKSYTAPEADKKLGASPDPIIEGPENAWVHPYVLQAMLSFVRDAYLCGDLASAEALLKEYSAALLQDPPKEAGWCTDFEINQYYSAQTEIATLQGYLSNKLDYFGNPAGWTPLFSLKASLSMFKNEIDSALTTLLVTEWVSRLSEDARATVIVAGQSIAKLDEDNKNASTQITKAKEIIDQLDDEINQLNRSIFNFDRDLKTLATDLRTKAENDLQLKAMINLAAQTLSAICQVIPYGQPALGAAGSLVPIIANYDPDKSFGQFSEVASGYLGAKFGEKAESLADEAKTLEEGKKKVPETETETETENSKAAALAKKKSEKLAHVGKEIGPAITKITDSIKALSVPQSEVDAELAKLTSNSPEFSDLVDRISKLNVKKADSANKLVNALNELAGAYNRISSNCIAISALGKKLREASGKVDHDAFLCVRDIGQRARMRLIRYQYYLVKSYESTVLKSPSEVNYKPDKVFDKLTSLIESSEFKPEKIPDYVKILKTPFQEVLGTIKEDLLKGYSVSRLGNFEVILDSQTPEIVAALNGTGKAIIDPSEILKTLFLFHYGVRIGNIKFRKIETEPPTLNSGGNLEFSLVPIGNGTIRTENKLFAVRHPSKENAGKESISEMVWGAIKHMSSGAIQASEPDKDSIALLEELMGIEQTGSMVNLAKPAAWTNFEFIFKPTLGPRTETPEITRIETEWELIHSPSLTSKYRNLDIRTPGNLEPLILCSEDINKRSYGYGNLQRIFYPDDEVILSAPQTYGKLRFDKWIITDTQMKQEEVSNPVLNLRGKDIKIVNRSDSLRIDCIYEKEAGRRIKGGLLVRPPADRSKSKKLRSTSSLKEGIWIGAISLDDGFEVLEGPIEVEGLKWMKVLHKGIVGWLIDEESMA